MIIRYTFALCALVAVATADAARPPRVDLSAATGRSDAETFAWHEWEIDQAPEATKEFDGVSVTLRAAGPGPLEGFFHKPGVATGGTLVADGVRAAGAIEIVLDGLAPGAHSLATYHNLTSRDEAAELTLSAGDQQQATTPTSYAAENENAATAHVEFEATEGEPVVVRLSAASDQAPVVLNALEIDASDPQRRARRPQPADFDEHASGESGEVTLRWSAPESAVGYRVYLTSDRDWNSAVDHARWAAPDSSALVGQPDQPELTVSVDPADSLPHYAWRVDSLDEAGRVTKGEVWSFRVRHLAFPSAQGYGRFAIGGRGGRVIKVTNLDDSGPGSLRAAVEAEGPRTVVFDVSGRINLQSTIGIRNPYLTIAGHTAPGKGICLSNYNLGMMGTHDVVIRHLRVRVGDTSGETLDGMGMASSDHSIFDHCSISWTHDEAFSSRGAHNVTLQRTLISEALNEAGHRNYPPGTQHGYAASISGDIGSFHHNLLAHCAGRNWSLAGGIDQANVHAGRLDIRNNVVYNWKHRTTDGGAKQVNFVNNYYKPGPASTIKTYLNPDFENPAFGPQQYYVKGNITEGVAGPEGPTGPFEGMRVRGRQEAPVTVPTPFFPPHVDTHTAKEAFDVVLADVGCNVPQLDDHDRRVIRETRRGTTTYEGSKTGLPGIPDSQEDVGGWENYPEVHRPDDWDADGDGMPNEWEDANGFDPNDPADGPRDADGDGYTNLEEYLSELAGD